MSTFNRKRQIDKAIAELESQEPMEWNEHFLKSLSAWSGLTVEKVQEILNDPRYTHPPQRTEQEPMEDDFFKMIADRNPKPFPPQQRTWVGLTDEERQDIALEVSMDAVCITEAKLKEKNT